VVIEAHAVLGRRERICDHEWIAFSTCLDECVLMLTCNKCQVMFRVLYKTLLKSPICQVMAGYAAT
jgi:hypothetical protein